MIMSHRQNVIRDQFKPLDLYFAEQRSKFRSEDIDLIDKAERYMEEAITHKKAKQMERYEIPEKIQRLMRFVDWAKKRGGAEAFNDAADKDKALMTREEKEMLKPFWTRTYFVGK